MAFTVYLSGEIHTDWREQIIDGADTLPEPINFTSPVTDHAASDAAGDVLGEESSGFWRDHKSSKINAIRTKTLIEQCDMAVIRFGDKYKQWNAAFDAVLAHLVKLAVQRQNQRRVFGNAQVGRVDRDAGDDSRLAPTSGCEEV